MTARARNRAIRRGVILDPKVDPLPETQEQMLRRLLGQDAKPGLPYPWCLDEARCGKLGYCPRNPSCGD